MHIHFVIHEAFEAPGVYLTWAQQHHYQITYSRVYLGELLPKDIKDIDLLIIMGGPQSPATSIDECPYYDSKAEQQLIYDAIQANKMVLGVCLGAQLIGQALGANYEHSPEKEIGKYPITMTQSGQNHPLFSHFDSQLDVGHWHNDMPGLTADAVILAHSEGCPRQIIAYSDRVYGFQCHLEFTTEIIEMLISNTLNDLRHATKYRFVDTVETLRSHDYSDMNQKLYVFLDKLVAMYKSK